MQATKLELEDECYAYPVIEDRAIYLVKNIIDQIEVDHDSIKVTLNN